MTTLTTLLVDDPPHLDGIIYRLPERSDPPFMPRKLLIIDDQAGLTKVMSLVAKQAGYDARIVNAPLEAIDAFIEYRPDVVMVDMIMPEMDGIEVLTQILLVGAPVRVILTSGYGNAWLRLAEAVAHFHDMDTVSVLRKPFRREELLAVLESIAAELD